MNNASYVREKKLEFSVKGLRIEEIPVLVEEPLSFYQKHIILLIAIVIVAIVRAKNFSTLPREEQFEQIKGWLLGAVTLAEAQYGSGTGKIKLSVVYDAFVEKLPWLAQIISFDRFGELVDDALVEMRNLLESNKNIAAIVEDTNK